MRPMIFCNQGGLMIKEEFYFDSRDGENRIHAVRYTPDDGNVRGIVQIVHGMAEYVERYENLAEFLTKRGILVTGEDHLGHGKSVSEGGSFGYFCEQDPATVVVRDVHRLKKITEEQYPQVPYIILGHSMGSFITRDFAAKYGEELTGITICGTAGHFRGATEAESALLAAVAEGKGKESDPSFTADLMGWMCERCGNISIGNEWICSDPYVQRDHAEDPFDAFTRPTTNQSLLYFVQMMKAITGTEWAGKIPSDLPIYNIGGDQDPVGEYGKGIYEVTNWLVDTGHTVKTRVYSGYRHEIHNYDEIKDEVEAGIISFMDSILDE